VTEPSKTNRASQTWHLYQDDSLCLHLDLLKGLFDVVCMARGYLKLELQSDVTHSNLMGSLFMMNLEV